jgi:hypothetical protein
LHNAGDSRYNAPQIDFVQRSGQFAASTNEQ